MKTFFLSSAAIPKSHPSPISDGVNEASLAHSRHFFCIQSLSVCVRKKDYKGTAYGEGRGVYGGAAVARTEVCVVGESGAGGHCCGARAIFETLGFLISFGLGLGVFGCILDPVIRV
ncbi:hypothetical protein GOBAR_DD05186 [Gossypium barbadense]|nr:hypothetical protein GOBAR_DD05186 [Gossypium barbadense]